MLTTKVESSNLVEVSWENEQLLVTFKRGDRYRYEGVPIEQYNALVQAPSVGKFFMVEIKDGYPYHKLPACAVI